MPISLIKHDKSEKSESDAMIFQILKNEKTTASYFAMAIGLTLSVLLASCSNSNEKHVDITTLDTADIFLDATTPTAEVIPAFKTISLQPFTGSESLTAEIQYVDTNTQRSITQRAYRSNKNDVYKVLTPPFNINENAEVDVYLNENESSQYINTITISALPELNEANNPGEYSLHGMNAILKELESAIHFLELQYAASENQSQQATEEQWLLVLNDLVENFQAIISLCTDAVVFNSPINDPTTGETIINGESFALIDRIYLALSRRLVDTGILFDGNNLANGEITAPQVDESFTLFANSVEDFVATEEGIRILSSLSLAQISPSDSQELSSALSLFRATLLPSVVTQLVTDNLDNTTLPRESKLKIFDDSAIKMQQYHVTEIGNNFILDNAYNTIAWLKQSIDSLTR